MPYYHAKCGGEIAFWSRKCKKCGAQWPLSVLFGPSVPRGMTTFKPSIPERTQAMTQGFKKLYGKREKASYSKWGDKIPFIGPVAGMLPNWPRWARILSFLGFISILSFLIYWFFGR